MAKTYPLTAMLLLLVIGATAQQAKLDSIQKAAFNYLDSMVHYKKTKQRDKLRSTKREYIDFKKNNRYRYLRRVGLSANYTRQHIGLRKHNLINPSNQFFLAGASVGMQAYIGKSLTIESGLSILGNNKNSFYSSAQIVEARASDSMKVISSTTTNDNISLIAPYLQAYYKIPLGREIMFEPFLRVSISSLVVKQEATHFLVGKANNYNEIIKGTNYDILSLAFHPGVGISIRLSKAAKFFTGGAYCLNTFQGSLLNNQVELLRVTPSDKTIFKATLYERPKMKNGFFGTFGLQIIFYPYKYAHDKNYANPTVYDREIY